MISILFRLKKRKGGGFSNQGGGGVRALSSASDNISITIVRALSSAPVTCTLGYTSREVITRRNKCSCMSICLTSYYIVRIILGYRAIVGDRGPRPRSIGTFLSSEKKYSECRATGADRTGPRPVESDQWSTVLRGIPKAVKTRQDRADKTRGRVNWFYLKVE